MKRCYKYILGVSVVTLLAALVARGQVRAVAPVRGCAITQVLNLDKTIWVVHRRKTVNGVTVQNEPVLTTTKRSRALKACTSYLDGKPVTAALTIERRLR